MKQVPPIVSHNQKLLHEARNQGQRTVVPVLLPHADQGPAPTLRPLLPEVEAFRHRWAQLFDPENDHLFTVEAARKAFAHICVDEHDDEGRDPASTLPDK